MRKILPISLIHIYWCETLGWEKVPAPTHPLPQPGQVSTKNRLHVTQSLLFVSRLAPEPTPHSPLGLPSNHGRVAETFSLLQAKARQSCGPRGGYRVLREKAPYALEGPEVVPYALSIGSRETGSQSLSEAGRHHRVVGGGKAGRHYSRLDSATWQGTSRRLRTS